jgi:hypothetical protein
MEKTTLFPAIVTPESTRGAIDANRPAAGDEPRSLADWELVMVGGGETTPNW